MPINNIGAPLKILYNCTGNAINSNNRKVLVYKKYIWLLSVIPLLSAHCALAFFFDGLLQDLLVLEKINETNRAQLTAGLKRLWSGEEPVEPEKITRVPNQPESFDDLPGMPEDLREVIEFFTNGQKFARLGAHMPSGILLYGPPGTGKTSAARVIARQCGAAFFPCSGSSFVEVYVGTGALRVRELFEKARKEKRAVIFIDEIDAIGSARTGWDNSERTNTLNELLNQMDGFTARGEILVIAATNRIDVLDPALLRPGRFDRLIKLDPPTQAVRVQILAYYCTRVLYTGSLECLEKVALATNGFTGADLKNIIDEAAILAARENAPGVGDSHLYSALEKVRMRQR